MIKIVIYTWVYYHVCPSYAANTINHRKQSQDFKEFWKPRVSPHTDMPMSGRLGFAGGFQRWRITHHLLTEHLRKFCSWATVPFILSQRHQSRGRPPLPQGLAVVSELHPKLAKCDVSTTENNYTSSNHLDAQIHVKTAVNVIQEMFSDLSSSLPGSSMACYWASQYTGNQKFHTFL